MRVLQLKSSAAIVRLPKLSTLKASPYCCGNTSSRMALAEVESGKPALRYARMDGEAWVSSPAKRFGADGARDPA